MLSIPNTSFTLGTFDFFDHLDRITLTGGLEVHDTAIKPASDTINLTYFLYQVCLIECSHTNLKRGHCISSLIFLPTKFHTRKMQIKIKIEKFNTHKTFFMPRIPTKLRYINIV